MRGDGITARPYGPGDMGACLAIFDGNVPDYFAAAERAEFVAFLTGLAVGAPYLVLVRDGQVVACGGLEIEPGGRATLSWGMVDRAVQARGLGTRLTQARLAMARATPGVTELTLATSQHTQGFYARFGFVTTEVTPDGFGPCLDRWDMILRLA